MSPRAAGLEQARLAARKLLHRFGVEDPEHLELEGFAARLQIDLTVAPLDGALGLLAVGGAHVNIVLSERLTDPAERAFVIAHELGHYVLQHPSPKPSALMTPPEPPPLDARDPEAEADAFAMALLLCDPGALLI
jgi:hypothetical protein